MGRLTKLGSVTSNSGANRTQQATISAANIDGYENMSASDFIVCITGCYMGNGSSAVMIHGTMGRESHIYNANTGVLTISVPFSINAGNQKAVTNNFSADVYY